MTDVHLNKSNTRSLAVTFSFTIAFQPKVFAIYDGRAYLSYLRDLWLGKIKKHDQVFIYPDGKDSLRGEAK